MVSRGCDIIGPEASEGSPAYLAWCRRAVPVERRVLSIFEPWPIRTESSRNHPVVPNHPVDPNHPDVPNHHGQAEPFTGLLGYLAGATLILGRGGDARLAARLSRLSAADTVVDVGCGPGAAVRNAAKVADTVVGVDPAPEVLRIARLLTRHSDNVRYVQGTAEALPQGDASASVLWSLATVHHWADVDAGLSEARRVLRHGGRLVAIERHRGPEDVRGLASHGWTDAQAAAFADRCREHGFIDGRVERHHGRRRNTVSVTATAP